MVSSMAESRITRMRSRALYGLSKVQWVKRASEAAGKVANAALNPVGLRYETGLTFTIATLRNAKNSSEFHGSRDALYRSNRTRALRILVRDFLVRDWKIIPATLHLGYSTISLPSFSRFYLEKGIRIYKACRRAGLTYRQAEDLLAKIIKINSLMLDENFSYAKSGIESPQVSRELAAEMRKAMGAELSYMPMLIGIAKDNGKIGGALLWAVISIYKNKMTGEALPIALHDLAQEYDQRVYYLQNIDWKGFIAELLKPLID